MAVTITHSKRRNPFRLLEGLITPFIKPRANAVNGVEIQDAAGTAVIRVDTSNKRVNIGSAANATAIVDIAAGTTSKAQLRLRSGVAPTGGNLADGVIWYDGTDVFIRIGSTTYKLNKTSV